MTKSSLSYSIWTHDWVVFIMSDGCCCLGRYFFPYFINQSWWYASREMMEYKHRNCDLLIEPSYSVQVCRTWNCNWCNSLLHTSNTYFNPNAAKQTLAQTFSQNTTPTPTTPTKSQQSQRTSSPPALRASNNHAMRLIHPLRQKTIITLAIAALFVKVGEQ